MYIHEASHVATHVLHVCSKMYITVGLLRIVGTCGTCNVMYTFYEIVKNEMHIYIIPVLPVLYVSVIVQ
jgi:hypothetical protein